MFQPVYLDHNATTPLDPAVLEAMLPWLGAASAMRRAGTNTAGRRGGRSTRRGSRWRRRSARIRPKWYSPAAAARPTICSSRALRPRLKPGLLAVSAIEHPCVLKPAAQLARQGWQVETLRLTRGEGGFRRLRRRRGGEPTLVSVMLANNETGVVQDIAALATAARTSGGWFHSDAVQALGKLPLDFRALNAAGVHALTLRRTRPAARRARRRWSSTSASNCSR